MPMCYIAGITSYMTLHGASQDDIVAYKQDVMSLLRIESEDDLNRMLDLMTGRWSQAMVDYFNDGMKPGIIRHSAKFVLAALYLCDPYSGITNNIWESINCVIKDMLKWTEAPVDVIVLSDLPTVTVSPYLLGFGGSKYSVTAVLEIIRQRAAAAEKKYYTNTQQMASLAHA